MVKVIARFKRKPGMDVEAFRHYWLTRHPDAVTRLPGLKRYVQSHTLPGGYRKGEPAYDGVPACWLEATTMPRRVQLSMSICG